MDIGSYKRQLKPELSAVFQLATQRGYLVTSNRDGYLYNLWFRWCEANGKPHIYIFVKNKYANLEADQIAWAPYWDFSDDDRDVIADVLLEFVVVEPYKGGNRNYYSAGSRLISISKIKAVRADVLGKKLYSVLTEIADRHTSDVPGFNPAQKTPRRGLSTRIRFKIFKRDDYTCQICGRSYAEHKVVLEVDHKVPASKGGGDDETNLHTACWDCNRGKRDDLL